MLHSFIYSFIQTSDSGQESKKNVRKTLSRDKGSRTGKKNQESNPGCHKRTGAILYDCTLTMTLSPSSFHFLFLQNIFYKNIQFEDC